MSLWSWRSVVVVLLGFLGSLTTAEATTLAGITQDALIRQSQLIVHATPMPHTSRWRSGRIVSTFTLEVSRTLAGPKRSTIEVELLGGTVSGISQQVTGVPALELHKPKLFFLRLRTGSNTYIPIQLGLGVFEPVAESNLWAPMTGDVRNLGPTPEPVSLERLTSKVRALRTAP